MSHRRRGWIVGTFLILFATWFAELAAQVTITDLGPFDGSQGYALDVNGAGRVVGYERDATGYDRAVLWEGGSRRELGDLGGESRAQGVNEAGQIYGSWYPPGEFRSFFWDEGAMVDLGAINGGTVGDRHSTFARSMNELGQLVGSSYCVPYDCPQPFFWEVGVMTHLPTIGVYVFANDVNDWGTVVGHGFTAPSAGGLQALRWERVDGAWQRQTLMHEAFARDVNNLGQVLLQERGTYQVWLWQGGALTAVTDLNPSSPLLLNDAGQVAGKRANAAVLWEGGALEILGEGCTVSDLNEFGQVVGRCWESGRYRPVLWENGTATWLGDLGGSWIEVTALSDYGHVVGYGATPAGEVHAVLWTVPISPWASIPEVEALMAQIEELVATGELRSGEGSALVTVLGVLTGMLREYRVTAATGLLTGFIQQVIAKVSAGRIPPAAGEEIVAAAGEILASLG